MTTALKNKLASHYRISTITVDAQTMVMTPEDKREAHIISLLETALQSLPDIVLLPEACWCYGAGCNTWGLFAEARDSARVRRISKLAGQYNSWIGLPILERRGGKIFNTLLLLDRNGRVVWHYDKIFLTEFEIGLGVSNGARPAAYESEFGRIGAAICFDLNFMELAEYWERQAVDLILFPSMYRGGNRLKAWALATRAFVATAASDERSQIVSPAGHSLTFSSHYSPVITQDLPRDFEVFHIDKNVEQWDSLRSKYGPRIHLEISSEEALFTLESRDPKLSVASIIKQHKLLPLQIAQIEWRQANGRPQLWLRPE